MKVLEVIEQKPLNEVIQEGILDLIKDKPKGKPFTVSDPRFEGFKFTYTKRGSLRITDPDGAVKTLTKNQIRNPDRVNNIVTDYNIRKRRKIEPTITGRTPLNKPDVSRISDIDPDGDSRRDMRPAGDDDKKAASRDKNPKPKNTDGFIKNIKKAFGIAAGGTVGGVAGPVGVIVNIGLSVTEAEEELDNFLRIMAMEVERQFAEGKTAEEINAGPTPKMVKAYDDAIDLLVEAAIKGVGGTLLGVTAGRVMGAAGGAAAIAILGTGPVGWITALVAGGITAYYGSEAIYYLIEKAGAAEIIREQLKKLVPITELGNFALTVDKYQPIGDDPMFGDDKKESVNEAADKEAFADNLKQIIMSDPKLRQAYKKGKAKAKAA